MVFFNCNACGEAVKKNQVENHYRQQCRNCQVLSCVDCGKEFWGDAYQQHTKCITEDEKHGGKNYKPKPNANKGEQKQELWVKQVQDAISKLNANPKLKNLLERLEDYPNIPRKQAKFENFLRNSLRVMDTKLATQAWNAISAELKNTTTESTNGNVAVTSNPGNKVAGKIGQGSGDGDKIENGKKETKNEGETVLNEDDVGSHEGKKNKKKRKHEDDTKAKDSAETTADDIETQHRKKKKAKHENKCKVQENAEETLEDDDSKTQEEQTDKIGKDSKKKKKRKHKKEEGQELKNEAVEVPKKKQKTKAEETKLENGGEEEEEEKGESNDEAIVGTFKWEAAIIGVLKRTDGKEMSVKKLRKKVLGEFNARGGDGKTYTEEQLLAKFTKKITHNSKLKVLKESVKLVH